MPSRVMAYPTPTPTATQPIGLVSRPQSTTSKSGSAHRKTVLTKSKASDVAARCLINTLRSVLASLLCLYGFVCRNIVFNTSKAYDVSPLCLIIAFLLGLTSPLCLYGLVVCLPFGEIASKRLKFWVHQSMGCDVACSIEQTGSAYHSGACKIHGLLAPAGSWGLKADTASELETSSCLAHDEGVLAGDAGTCVPRASRAGDFDVSSKEKVGEVRIPGSQDKVDGFHDEDFGSQTMIRGYGGTSPQSRDTSRRCEREQPGDPEIAHRSQQSALGLDNIVHSSQGTTSNTQLFCDRTLISPVSGRDAVTLPSPPVDHSNMSPVSSPSSILSSGSSLRTLVDSKSSLGGSHTDEALPNNFKSLDTQIQSTESIRHSEKHGPSVEATLSKSNADKNLKDQLSSNRVDPILTTIFPRNSSLWRYYLCGRYLGKGGFGKVKLSKVDGMPMVIKKSSRDSAKSFSQSCEAVVMKTLNHPNIVRSHSSSRWLNSLYIAMEYLDGGDLSKLKMQGSGGLIATVMREALKGLAHMHEQNYAHCDIKPENIFLTKNGEVKIGDLGCARYVLGTDGGQRGTFPYMAPEIQAEINPTAGDIWSLAVTAIELFAGELPTNCIGHLCYQGKRRPRIPEGAGKEFKEFLHLATELDWQKRATAQELLDLPFIKNAPPTDTLIPEIQEKKR